MNYRTLFGFVFCLIMVLGLETGCDSFQDSKQAPEVTKEDSRIPESVPESNPSSEILNTEEEQETMTPKGISPATARIASFNLATSLPLVSSLIGDNETLRNEVETFAKRAKGQGITTEADILEVIRVRQEEIIPAIDPLINAMDENAFFDQTKELANELQSIGLDIATIEGMYAGMVVSPILENEMKVIGSDPFKLYNEFLNAEGASIGGEYPYSDMEPFRQMVLIGEKLMTDYGESEYFSKVEETFRYALDVFTGIYLQKQGTYTMPVVGGPVDLNELSLTEMETHKLFLKENTDSRYHSIVQEMTNNLSEASVNPETLYLVTVGWVDTEEEASAQRYAYLDAGKGVLHQLKVKLGDGSQKYALVYRFYEDSEKSTTAFDSIEKDSKDAQLLMVSVNKGELYQMGI